MDALMWISHAGRPLKPDELCHAIAVEIGSLDVNADNVPSIGTLLLCCQGLVVMDKEASTVRLIHFTLQEYLKAHVEFFGVAHATMAETCLSYLNSQQVKALPASSSPDLPSTPFLEYSSVYWGVHAKRGLSNRAELLVLALKLFDDYNNQIPTRILLEAQEYYSPTIDSTKLFLFRGLHYASFFGIVEIVVGLMEVEGCDINQEDCIGNTPLGWAACNGHEGVVEILLGEDHISADKPDMDGQTPLCCAAQHGHEGVVKMLLRRDINPNKPDIDGQTPLCCATQSGHEGVVKMLLGRDDVDPDRPDNHGLTPLCCAAWNGHVGVVKVLLGRGDVNPNKPGWCGRTPLWFAAENGREGVVEILLGRDDINPDKSDIDGQTPLCCAAQSGHEGVIKMLLRRDDVNPDKPDNCGLTPLWHALLNGQVDVVEVILDLGGANPNKPGWMVWLEFSFVFTFFVVILVLWW